MLMKISIFIQPLDNSAWFTFLPFAVGQLWKLSNMNLTQSEQRQNQRKRSIKYQAAQTYQEFSEKLDGGFVQILEPRKNLVNNETLENSLTYQGLLLNLMSKISTQLIMEHKIYDELLSIYLKLDANKLANILKVQNLIVIQYFNIKEHLYYQIHWYMLNNSNVPNITPAIEILGSVCKNVRQIFDWLWVDQQLATESLMLLFKFQKKFDIVIEEEKNEANKQQPSEEEFANKLLMVESQKQPGQPQQYIVEYWQLNKKRVKAKIHVLTLKDEFSENYILEFQLEKSIELKQIRIGFQAYTPEIY
ncbi:unnamed protein product [Paramecium sonneborni]|uniref:Uncharacterized protein n=1 Tax=Paramecium sonneborni TaxID=65129 RepID=A0A8S1RUW2_9CILI|nr:unnamed protein product [Paramecium sonneborni]